MKILYIARGLNDVKNGANQVMTRNLKALIEIVGKDNLTEFYLPDVCMRNVLSSIWRLGSYGVSKRDERRILNIVERDRPDYVFIESSSFGSLYRELHKRHIRTICFAHNLDTYLCWQEIGARNPLISIPKYLSVRINERRCAKYADIMICLSKRDSEGFESMFGRNADLILPITFPTRICTNGCETNSTPYYIFVGSDFFPNVEGIAWFIKEVAPYVNVDFRIIGSCCDNPNIRQMCLPDNVKLIGYADNIESEYINASGIIAPIFKGSGMKTKTIEAMSYGKSVIGTTEAFAGIECDISEIGVLCNTSAEFIGALSMPRPILNQKSLSIFEHNYSDSFFVSQLRLYLESSNTF